MQFRYIGLIKKNSEFSKVLVVSEEKRYYVWTAIHEKVDSFRIKGFGEIDLLDLELANQNQIEIGRGTSWIPNSSLPLVKVVFYGIVSGGKRKKTILVKLSSDYDVFYIIKLLLDDLVNVKCGDILTVDKRFLFPAREDHIKAGLGLGTLERRKRVSVP